MPLSSYATQPEVSAIPDISKSSFTGTFTNSKNTEMQKTLFRDFPSSIYPNKDILAP